MNTQTIGDRWLSAWQVDFGVTWIQTRSPKFARKLSQRMDSRLVASGVSGGYLRTYEFHHGMAWAARLFGRYTQNQTATNARKVRQFCPPLRREVAVGQTGG